MSLVAPVRSYIRQFIGRVPQGSMLMYETPDGNWDHLEWLDPEAAPSTLHICLDTPDDEMIDFEVPVASGTVPDQAIEQAQQHFHQHFETPDYRRQAIARYGAATVQQAETLLYRFSIQALAVYNRFRPQGWPSVEKRPELKWSWSPHRTTSRGGARHLFIAIEHALATLQRDSQQLACTRFGEYPTICRDRDIGDLYSENWRDHLRCLVAHEMAHFIQYTLRRYRHPLDLEKPHGEGWQAIYRVLRRHWVNPLACTVCHTNQHTPAPITGALYGPSQ